jgi:peptide/nickel transport system substrate-binding protein
MEGLMDERELRQWIQRVKDGTITRRQFTRTMVGLGLTAPSPRRCSRLRRRAGAVEAGVQPTKRGGGGPVKTLWWQRRSC